MQTRQQQYATAIFAQVDQVKRDKEQTEEGKAFITSYGSMAHQLPVLIRTAGLAQALAFVEARAKPDGSHQCLLNHLSQTVLGDDNSRQRLLERSRTDQLRPYMRLTQQVLEALLWYKRFAQSVLKVEAGQSDQTQLAISGGSI
jgi:CRISPR-associated protein Cmr5